LSIFFAGSPSSGPAKPPLTFPALFATMPRMKKITRQITVGNVKIGGGAPCSVQSMCNTVPGQRRHLVQIRGDRCRLRDRPLRRAGHAAAEALGSIKQGSPIPVIADIHFDYRLALRVLRGIDGLRLTGEYRRAVEGGGGVQAAKERLCRSGSASMPARWKRSSWKNTATRRPRRWWSRRWACPDPGGSGL